MFSFKSFQLGWDRFFHSKTDATTLCIFRILFSIFLFINGISLIEDFDEWFGVSDNAIVPLFDSLKFYAGMRINLFHWLTPTESSAWFVLNLYILSSFFMMIGFKTRISTIVCFVLIVSLQNRNYAILNSGDTLMRCMLFLMIFAPTHVKYSLDSLLKKKTGESFDPEISILSIRLMQLQFSLVYLATTLFKLKGYDWVDGTAVYYTSRLMNFQRFVLPVVFDYPFLVKFATWSALFIELAMGTLVWVKEFRIWVLVSGLILHLAIEVSMSIGFFEWVMVSTYILFILPSELEWFKSKFRKASSFRLRPA